MMTDRQNALSNVLLSSFPNFQSGDAESALIAYELVMNQADERDLEPGVMILLNGQYPGHDGRFAPTAPQLATALRMARDKRLDRERDRRPALPPPDINRSPEAMARVRALMEQTVNNLGGSMRTDEASADKRRREARQRVVRADRHFAADYVETPGGQRISRDLAKKIGFSVGDPEGDRDVA